MKKSPLSVVKERFETKEKLLKAVQALATDELWLDRVSDAKGLEHVSNAKLIRLHDTLSEVKKEFGNRAKLIDAIVQSENRGKDAGYKNRLERYPLPRLLDMQRSSKKRSDKAKAKKATAQAKN